ncbi:MAG TPA: LytTR family DNA-binding domain-containing protein, partial [Stellaceae bacterium]|nr:LytTR family DNA-binding domain-containing protein [Stellaceae bacterium]
RQPDQIMSAPNNLIQSAENLEVEVGRDKRLALWDQLRGAVTKRFQTGPTAYSLAPYGWLALLIVTNAAVSTLSSAHDAAQRGAPYALLRPGYFEVTGGLCTLFMLPLVRRGIHLVARCRGWITRLALASLVASLYAVAHIAILIPIRKLSFGIVGGSYTFNWLTQGPYDFRREIIAAMVFGGAFWLFDRATAEPGAVPAPVEAPPAEEPHLWLRDGTMSVRIDPRAIVTVSSAGNYVEFSLIDKSYLIRATLAGEQTRLRPFGVRRVHRTRLVNFNRVVAVEPRPGGDFNLRMDNGEQIAGSRRYRDAVKSMTAAAGA